MDAKTASKICNNFLQFYFKTPGDKPELDYECIPFMNLVQAVWENVYSSNYSDSDLTIFTVKQRILELESIPDNISSFYNSLITSTQANFEGNKSEHFVVIPLHGSRVDKLITFADGMFCLIPTEDDEKSLFSRMSDVMGIDNDKCVHMFEHTKRSRSPDFFKHNLLLIRIENQTQYVRQNAITIAIHSIYLLHLLYWALETKEDALFSLRKIALDGLEENNHVLIMSDDDWRCGHGNTWSGVPRCKIDLQFFEDKKYQSLFSHLFLEFILKPRDELTRRFLNSLILLNRGFQFESKKDQDLATLLYTTSAEALLTEGKNEKRLRLAATLSKLICIEGKTRSEIANILSSVYEKRNNFVHAGRSPFYEYREDSEDDLTIMRIAISKLIFKYNNLDTILSKYTEGERSKKWDSFIDQMFKDIIFG